MALAISVAVLLLGCDGSTPDPGCRCEGAVPGGTLSVACGGTQCVGGMGYRCTDVNTAIPDPAACGIVLQDGGPGACGPATCGGCCDGDSCVSGASPSGCGSGGNACMICGPSFICAAGACSVDPASRWNVVLETLRVPTTDYAGRAWDAFGGAPDPFVEIQVGSDTATIETSGSGTDTFTVNFSGGATATNKRADALRTLLRFDVMDEDTTAHDFIGACSATTLDERVFAGTTQTLMCPVAAATMNSGFTLTWHLTRF